MTVLTPPPLLSKVIGVYVTLGVMNMSLTLTVAWQAILDLANKAIDC